MTNPTLPQIVEALLFASPEPLTTSAIVRAIRAAVNAAAATSEGDNAGSSEGEDPGEASDVLPGPGAVEVEHGDEDESALGGGGESVALEVKETADLAKVSDSQVLDALAELAAVYAADGRAFTLAERATGWRIFTRAEYGPWVRGLFPERRPHRLSQPALETLAIIAYRQPITKAAVEAVRGVSIDGPLQKLLDQNIIRIAGRADLPGRPLLYETTDLFFEFFGIRSVDDLPNASELRRVAIPMPDEEKPSEIEVVQPELPIGGVEATDGTVPA